MLRLNPHRRAHRNRPRLAALVAQVSDHFGGRPIHVVSGFRPYSPVQYTVHSNHNAGRAMDFSIEGVPTTAVRDFCRTFRDAGVGFYPEQYVRSPGCADRKSYWIDYSRAGEAPRYDSPSSQGAADEAARDVEPHAGAVDPPDDASPPAKAPTPDADSDPGSHETRSGSCKPLKLGRQPGLLGFSTHPRPRWVAHDPGRVGERVPVARGGACTQRVVWQGSACVDQRTAPEAGEDSGFGGT